MRKRSVVHYKYISIGIVHTELKLPQSKFLRIGPFSYVY